MPHLLLFEIKKSLRGSKDLAVCEAAAAGRPAHYQAASERSVVLLIGGAGKAAGLLRASGIRKASDDQTARLNPEKPKENRKNMSESLKSEAISAQFVQESALKSVPGDRTNPILTASPAAKSP